MIVQKRETGLGRLPYVLFEDCRNRHLPPVKSRCVPLWDAHLPPEKMLLTPSFNGVSRICCTVTAWVLLLALSRASPWLLIRPRGRSQGPSAPAPDLTPPGKSGDVRTLPDYKGKTLFLSFCSTGAARAGAKCRISRRYMSTAAATVRIW